MIATPTTTVTVYGVVEAADTDVYDDPTSDDTPTAVDVPASILEQSRLTTTHTSDRLQVVRSYTARLPAGTDVTAGTRLVDEATGYVYLVDATSQPANPHVVNDIRADLRRVS